MEPLPKQLPRFFWYFIKPYKLHVAGLILVAFLWALYISIQPYILKLLINGAINYGQSQNNLKQYLLWPASAYVILSLLRYSILFRFYDYMVLQLIPNLKRDIERKMFSYLEQHSYYYFQNHFAGSLSNKIFDMVRGLPEILILVTDRGVVICLSIIMADAMMYSVKPILALILTIWALTFFCISWLLSKKGQYYSREFSEAGSILVGKVVDSITNITNVRLFASNKFEDEYVSTYTDDYVDKDRRMQWYILKVRTFQSLSATIMTALIMLFLVYGYIHKTVTIGDFALVLTLISKLVENFWGASNEFVRFGQTVGNCKQALSIISVPHEIIDAPHATELNVTHGRIDFNNVTFHYQRNHNLFHNKNVSIAAGSKVGLVGFSGSGKTTFVNLILRFFEIESGRIMIDGQDITKVTQDSLHKNIALIPQDTSLFHRTLIENIRYGRLSATDEEVIDASKKAHCHDFISKLPDGYNSLVGERGIKLSGGQRQRIAIARAILKQAPILILDEATSSLDSVTEKHIQSGLHNLMAGCTTIVIAHRLSTLAEMDRILVFDKGHIIEDGSHNQLLKTKGHYAKMWHMQAGGFLPENESVL